jgi:dephospho-CoA kinase
LNTKVFVGITGGIGSGKTFVCQTLKAMGYPVFFSDQEAKNILVNNPNAKKQITGLFGADSYLKNGELNRKYLSNQIFNNKNLLEKMNQIVHPLVRTAFKEWSKQQTSNIIFNEVAIIFETGIYRNYDHIILVIATKETKIKRINKRDNSSAEEIEKRMNAQWPDEQKIPLSNFVIDNNDSMMIIPQIINILDKVNTSSIKQEP